MRKNKQRGYIFEASGAFHLRYSVYEGGKRRVRSRKLCDKDELYSTKESVRPIADDFIKAIVAANASNDAKPGHCCPLCGYRCKRTIQGKFAPRESDV